MTFRNNNNMYGLLTQQFLIRRWLLDKEDTLTLPVVLIHVCFIRFILAGGMHDAERETCTSWEIKKEVIEFPTQNN